MAEDQFDEDGRPIPVWVPPPAPMPPNIQDPNINRAQDTIERLWEEINALKAKVELLEGRVNTVSAS